MYDLLLCIYTYSIITIFLLRTEIPYFQYFWSENSVLEESNFSYETVIDFEIVLALLFLQDGVNNPKITFEYNWIYNFFYQNKIELW